MIVTASHQPLCVHFDCLLIELQSQLLLFFRFHLFIRFCFVIETALPESKICR